MQRPPSIAAATLFPLWPHIASPHTALLPLLSRVHTASAVRRSPHMQAEEQSAPRPRRVCAAAAKCRTATKQRIHWIVTGSYLSLIILRRDCGPEPVLHIAGSLHIALRPLTATKPTRHMRVTSQSQAQGLGRRSALAPLPHASRSLRRGHGARKHGPLAQPLRTAAPEVLTPTHVDAGAGGELCVVWASQCRASAVVRLWHPRAPRMPRRVDHRAPRRRGAFVRRGSAVGVLGATTALSIRGRAPARGAHAPPHAQSPRARPAATCPPPRRSRARRGASGRRPRRLLVDAPVVCSRRGGRPGARQVSAQRASRARSCRFKLSYRLGEPGAFSSMRPRTIGGDLPGDL